PVLPHFKMHQTGQVESPPLKLPGGAYEVQVAKVTPPNEGNGFQPTVVLQTKPTNPVDVAAFDISTKPFVNVLWLGGYMMFLGGILAWRKRVRVADHASRREPHPEPTPEAAG